MNNSQIKYGSSLSQLGSEKLPVSLLNYSKFGVVSLLLDAKFLQEKQAHLSLVSSFDRKLCKI